MHLVKKITRCSFQTQIPSNRHPISRI